MHNRDPPTKKCNVSENSASKISYSKLAGFLRSKVRVTLKTTKETPSSNDTKENSENGEFCKTGKTVKFPTSKEAYSSSSDGYTIEETMDLKAPKRVSSVTLFRSNTSKDSPAFKKKILFLKSTKNDSPNRITRKKDKVCFHFHQGTFFHSYPKKYFYIPITLVEKRILRRC